MAQPLLNGEQEYVIDAPDPHLQELEAEVRELKRKLAHAELETRHAREDIGHVLGNLQRMTKPFLDLLKAVHGEIEAAGFSPAPAAAAGGVATPQFDPKWDAWKQKLGHGTAVTKVIDALLTHGPLTRNQLRTAAAIGWSTLDAATSRLKNLGLIDKANDRWSLR